MRDGDTIVALSSGAVPSGVAIIRLSGPLAGDLVERLAGAMPPARRLGLCALAVAGELVDQGLVAWFPAPRSFTGEDCAELQVHGSPAVVRALLRHLTARDGVRLAEAGEFTRRAFENGKLDLVEIEGLGDLIAAETEGQRRQAIARLGGALSRQVEGWRAVLLEARAEIEARLDFSDEGDVDAVLPPRVADSIAALREGMVGALQALTHGRIVREGLRVAIAGLPNAGKSSLLNALSKSDLAIVSDEAGTTRDVREVAIDLEGQLVILIDMAGLRNAESRAEAEGVRRAQAEIERADLVLWLQAPDVADGDPADMVAGTPIWKIGTKADLAIVDGSDLVVSVKSGSGIDDLMRRLAAFVEASAVSAEDGLLSRERDREAIERAVEALDAGGAELQELELAAEDLRVASHALARLLGEIDADDVLDRLFASFCIGK